MGKAYNLFLVVVSVTGQFFLFWTWFLCRIVTTMSWVSSTLFWRLASGSCHKRQRGKRHSVTTKREKSQTPKFVTAILTYVMTGLPIIWWLRTLAFATVLVWRLRIGACGVDAIEGIPLVSIIAATAHSGWATLSSVLRRFSVILKCGRGDLLDRPVCNEEREREKVQSSVKGPACVEGPFYP